MKTFKCILRRINSFLCDLALVYALFYLLLFIRPIGFSATASYFCSVIIYFGLTYWLFSGSLMQKLLGIEIKKHRLNYLFFKLLWLALIPLFLSILHYEFFLVLYVLAIPVLSIILFPFTKKSLWQWCSSAQIELQKATCIIKLPVIILLTVTIGLIFFPLFNLSSSLKMNLNTLTHKSAYPISMPEKAYYLKNIRQYKKDPVNYIMQLFDEYDIIIFCERLHPEYTQWEFFSDIIMNDSFAVKVKNVFTELGQVDNQAILDTYMQTHFPTQEDLQKATARIVRENGGGWPVWRNTNIYDFILHLHQFNEIKNEENRINFFFSDLPINWEEIKTQSQYDSIWAHNLNRDSIMAYNIINQYTQLANQKCLIITNTRHAWNYGKNETAYICEKFPDKTAVVWINGTTQLFYPAMNGTLDAAAIEIPDSIWAIDFKNCPLGNTYFDLFPPLNNLTYNDLFVGMVYCKHPGDWIKSENYPFILDNFQDTLLERSAFLGEKYVKRQQDLIAKGFFDTIHSEQAPFIILNNLVFLSIHSIILLFLFLNLLVLLLRKQKTKQL